MAAPTKIRSMPENQRPLTKMPGAANRASPAAKRSKEGTEPERQIPNQAVPSTSRAITTTVFCGPKLLRRPNHDVPSEWAFDAIWKYLEERNQ